MSISKNLKPTKSKVRGDKVALLLGELAESDPDEHAALKAALEDFDSYSHADIGRALRAAGHDINNFQVRHLRTKIREGEVEL